jgi:hypothetical protein
MPTISSCWQRQGETEYDRTRLPCSHLGSHGIAGYRRRGAETLVSATGCEIPTSLEVGKTYWFAIGIGGELRVVEINQQTCWIKAEERKGIVFPIIELHQSWFTPEL